MQYCMYLRKSRADMEAEAHGEGETLARHEKLLFELAKKRNYNITQIYREIVSGETIAARPVMQQLLQEVEQGVWAGVLVVEVERLARGDTIDQGIVAQAFKYSGTEIITPLKVFRPDDEFDEEYFEFGLFMSRREYKTINRRLQRGRDLASKEGKFVSGNAPYGYERVRVQNDKGWTLQIVEAETDIVRFIFNLYASGEELADGSFSHVGTYQIARRLDEMGVPSPSGGKWSEGYILRMLKNPAYIGKVRWHYRRTKKVVEDGVVRSVRYSAPLEEQIIVDGLHDAIISEELFLRVQDIIKAHGRAPVKDNHILSNSMAGLLVCAKCGRTMAYVSNNGRDPWLRCPSRGCDNIGAYYTVVEERLLQALSDWLAEYRLQWDNELPASERVIIEAKQKALRAAGADVGTLQKQLARTHDLLEQGVYDTDTFLERSRSLTERISAADSLVSSLDAEIAVLNKRAENRKNIIPKVERLLEVYSELPSPNAKNEVLKEVLEKVSYLRTEPGYKGGPKDNFELTLYPRLPASVI